MAYTYEENRIAFSDEIRIEITISHRQYEATAVATYAERVPGTKEIAIEYILQELRRKIERRDFKIADNYIVTFDDYW